jgi:hypothetical protein
VSISPRSLPPATIEPISPSHSPHIVSNPPLARRGRGKARRPRAPLSPAEIKRKHEAFLERNRLAAMKCRSKKKGWQAQLEENVKLGQEKNDELRAQCERLTKEVAELQSLVVLYKDRDGVTRCQCEKPYFPID